MSPLVVISAGAGLLTILAAIIMATASGLAFILPAQRKGIQQFISPLAFLWASSAAVYGVSMLIGLDLKFRGTPLFWNPIYLVCLAVFVLFPQSNWFRPIRTDCRAAFFVSIPTPMVFFWMGLL